jgi:tetraacyldisaccharide 4'-kinase
MLDALYAAAARRRREWYAARPDQRRRLRRPVISIGNIAVGGRGKTPLTALVAQRLLEMGERPAILSRGYGRRDAASGVVVVRDATGMRADLDRAGDEPLMLARQLPGAIVLASSDRYLAGRLAAHHLGATVHLLDDGFQHPPPDRDLDLVIVSGDDLAVAARTLPGGRLREPADVLLAADAVLALDDEVLARGPAPRNAPFETFRMKRQIGEPVDATLRKEADSVALRGEKVLAVAGIAGPQRFFDDLRAAGAELVRTLAFPDHFRFGRRDVDRMFDAARAAGATRIVTTEKDVVRLLPFRPFPARLSWVPLTMEPDPLPAFRSWLASGLAAARDLA